MPLPLSSDLRTALKARTVFHAWLLELFCDEGTLRCWDKRFPLTFEGNTFEGLGDLWGFDGEIRIGSDLVAEPLPLWFDGAAQLDDSSFIGRLLDRSWHERNMRLRQVIMSPTSEFTVAVGVALDLFGRMDDLTDTDQDGAPSNFQLACEVGPLWARDRNLRTVTDVDQREIDPNDGIFSDIGVKPFQEVPFGTSWSNIPGSRPGSSGNVGGSGNSPGSDLI